METGPAQTVTLPATRGAMTPGEAPGGVSLEDLVLRMRAGDRDAAAEFMTGYGPLIRRRVRGKLKDYSTQHIETVFRVGYRLRACLPQAGLSRPQWFE